MVEDYVKQELIRLVFASVSELNWVRLKVYLQKHLKFSKHRHCLFPLGLPLFFKLVSLLIQKSYV